ncbi:Hypp118 [Branchiostoma lanceolatum]|uniref:Hypp118 protein n=1 Tax=Branchiostoma lanceolatum TaxID=7740 RepID=A0A8J9YM08_BRALA|nr:Hypp118 [Branchiostoma lanceolatum]
MGNIRVPCSPTDRLGLQLKHLPPKTWTTIGMFLLGSRGEERKGRRENNAIAVLDMATATFDDIYPLGSKYWGTASIDTSIDDGGIVMRDWPIYSIYQPDSMRTFSHRGRNYILTANEGDGVERAPPNATASTDELKGAELTERSLLSPKLKSQRLRSALNSTSQLGCAVFSSLDGLDPQNPDKYASLHLFGGRGFSVWNADDVSLVWDSEDEVERMVAKYYPSIFNSDYDEDVIDSTPAALFDHRSCKKGPETESLAIGEVGGKTVFFVGNERSSTILVYSLADEDIITPVFQSISFSGRLDLTWRQAYQDRVVGDIDPEDMRFVSARDSPTNTPLLLVAGTVSGTVSVYEVMDSDDIISASPSMAVSWFVMTVSAATFLAITNVVY